MIQRLQGTKKKPVTPEIDPAWIEALKNSKPVAPTASVGMKMPYTNVRQADEAITSRAQAQQNYKNYYDQRVPVRTGDVYNNSLKALADVGFRHGVQYPIESLHRTLTLQNAPKYLNPFNDASISQRLGALGEDAINLAGAIPFTRAAAEGLPELATGIKTAKNQLAARMNAKFTPTASLDNYMFHGGVPIEKLEGGVLDPEFVRGGEKFINKDKPGMMPVNTGPNQVERDFILSEFEGAEQALSGNPYTSDVSKFMIYDDPRMAGVRTQEELDKINSMTREKAAKYIEKHSEIVRRIKAGEEHQTGVDRLIPDMTYQTQGGNYVLNIPSNLQTNQVPSPMGEIKFWGKHKPVAFISNANNDYESVTKLAVQEMLNDADRTSLSTQKLANLLAKMRGTKVTPAYKTYAQEVLNKYANKSIYKYSENLNAPTIRSRYNIDFNESQPLFSDYDKVVKGIQQAKTEKEVLDLISNLSPAEQADIGLSLYNSGPSSVAELKARLIQTLTGVNPNYSRLKPISSNETIVIGPGQAPKASQLYGRQDWSSLTDEQIAFAKQFLDPRTSAEEIKRMYDYQLYSQMTTDPVEASKELRRRINGGGF